MALPQDGQNANGLTKVTEVPTGKELIFVDPTTNEGGIITLEDLTTQILNKLTSKIFTLDQGNITLIEALNKLNSNSLKLNYIECDINTIANKVVRITSENIIKGEVPKDEHYIPIVHTQSATNEYEVSIRYDYPSWIVYSNVGQSLGIRFYKCTK